MDKTYPSKVKVFTYICKFRDLGLVLRQKWQKTQFLNDSKTIDARGWTLDIFTIIMNLKKNEFDLDEIYKFEPKLLTKYVNNSHIKDKIRQQLQILRDRQVIAFLGNGKYKILI